jgi:UDP-glucose 4-epimerase
MDIQLAKLRVTVLGGGGFLGTHLCNALSSMGARVCAYGRSRLHPDSLSPNVVWCAGELGDLGKLLPVLSSADIVYHLASASTPSSAELDPAGDLEANAVATVRLLDASLRCGVKRVIFASSGGTIYGNPDRLPIAEHFPLAPISAYGLHKLVIERYLAHYEQFRGLRSIIYRIANPFGPLQQAGKGQGVVAAFVQRALAGRPLELWGDGVAVRDFVYVEDVARALLLGAQYDGAYSIFNVGSSIGRSLAQVANDVEDVLGREPLPRILRSSRPAGVPANVLDCALIRAEMQWAPEVDWYDGLARTVSWNRAQRSLTSGIHLDQL